MKARHTLVVAGLTAWGFIWGWWGRGTEKPDTPAPAARTETPLPVLATTDATLPVLFSDGTHWVCTIQLNPDRLTDCKETP